jgi:hypothetical protein
VVTFLHDSNGYSFLTVSIHTEKQKERLNCSYVCCDHTIGANVCAEINEGQSDFAVRNAFRNVFATLRWYDEFQRDAAISHELRIFGSPRNSTRIEWSTTNRVSPTPMSISLRRLRKRVPHLKGVWA